MITARLEGQTTIKTCNQCKYETASIKDMTKHLNIHRLDELEGLQSKPMVYRRVLKE